MSEEKEREQFNQWLAKRGLWQGGEVNEWSGKFQYDYPVIDGMWQGWLARSKEGS